MRDVARIDVSRGDGLMPVDPAFASGTLLIALAGIGGIIFGKIAAGIADKGVERTNGVAVVARGPFLVVDPVGDRSWPGCARRVERAELLRLGRA